MILVCPSCGATHSAEAWENDMNARKAFAARATLPIEVSAPLPLVGLAGPARTLRVTAHAVEEAP